MRKHPYAVALGRKGGKKGGARKSRQHDGQEAIQSARHAVLARWKRVKNLEPARQNRRELNSEGFLADPTFDQLARQQRVGPMRDPRHLGGVLPDDFDVDEMVTDIYRERA